MHIRSVEITNVRSIRRLKWSVDESQAAGWHVVLGDNGSGKSGFLKAMCLALVGSMDAAGLRQPWNDWLTKGEAAGSIKLELSWNKRDDTFAGSRSTPKKPLLPVELAFSRDIATDASQAELSNKNTSPDPRRHVWNGGHGWFSASYGPFRRFAGGDAQSEKMFYSMPRLARHLSLFDERVALSECLEWLRSLKFKSLENDSEGLLLEKVKTFLNESDLLPSGVKLDEVSSKAVLFKDANGITLPVEDLSDGFRSVLSMTFELIRQFSIAFGPCNVFSETDPTIVTPSGVVVIDEVDAHLHPTWQRRIGLWFCKHFPNTQFIVSTHSPLVCQSAEKGTIFVLPRAGTQESADFVKDVAFQRLVFGNVLDAYGTEAFGSGSALTRSDASKEKRRRLAMLNTKEIHQGLTDTERTEQGELRAILPLASSLLE